MPPKLASTALERVTALGFTDPVAIVINEEAVRPARWIRTSYELVGALHHSLTEGKADLLELVRPKYLFYLRDGIFPGTS